jgi:hypothetical protein
MQVAYIDVMQNELSTRDLLNAAYKIGVALGRKFEASDMTPALRQAARSYAANYAGDFEYMVEMRLRVLGGTGAFLSDGQSKGVLNVLMADARKRLQGKAPATAQAAPAAAIEVPLGTFTVVALDGSRTTIKLAEAKAKDGRIFASYLMGADNDVDFQWFSTLRDGRPSGSPAKFPVQYRALQAILSPTADLAAMGLAYSLQSSNCWRCNRTLTVPASIHSGLGPDCAAKVGAMYGERPIAAEEAASAASQPAPAARIVSDDLKAEYAANGERKSRYERDQDAGAPRPAGGYTFEDVFPSDRSSNPAAVR